MSDSRMIRIDKMLAREIKVKAAENGTTIGEVVRQAFHVLQKQSRLYYYATCDCGHEIWKKTKPVPGMSGLCDFCGKRVTVKK